MAGSRTKSGMTLESLNGWIPD